MSRMINLKIELEDEFLSDTMTTMVESGGDALWYWADGDPEYFKDVKVERDDDLSVMCITFGIVTQYPGGTTTDRYVINHESVAKAIQSLLSHRPLNDHLMGYLEQAVRDSDAGDVDATLADCIAQQICFGEQVYS